MKLQFLYQPSGLDWLECFIERPRPVRVEIIKYDSNDFRSLVSEAGQSGRHSKGYAKVHPLF